MFLDNEEIKLAISIKDKINLTLPPHLKILKHNSSWLMTQKIYDGNVKTCNTLYDTAKLWDKAKPLNKMYILKFV